MLAVRTIAYVPHLAHTFVTTKIALSTTGSVFNLGANDVASVSTIAVASPGGGGDIEPD
jgi:hypothetical protein